MEDLDYWNSGTLVHSTSAFLMIRKTSVEILVNPISSVPYPLVDLVLVFAGPYSDPDGLGPFHIFPFRDAAGIGMGDGIEVSVRSVRLVLEFRFQGDEQRGYAVGLGQPQTFAPGRVRLSVDTRHLRYSADQILVEQPRHFPRQATALVMTVVGIDPRMAF